MRDEEGITYGSVEELPDDPLAMPPPYWLKSEAFEVLTDTLDEMESVLWHIPKYFAEALEHDYFSDVLYWERGLPQQEEEDVGALYWHYEQAELAFYRKSRVIILMMAIDIEDAMNMVSVFNLHKSVAEAIEKLRPDEKLSVIAGTLRGEDVRSQAVYESVKKIVNWRNSFAHGHPTDTRTGSLRKRHLLAHENTERFPEHFEDLKQMAAHYLRVIRFLRGVSLNPYTQRAWLGHPGVEELMRWLNRVSVETRDDRTYSIVDIADEAN